MLPLTKEYVISDEWPDRKIVNHYRNRQAQYYLEHIPRPEPFPLYPEERVKRVSEELENILDLLEWCKQQGNSSLLVELFLRIQDFLGVFGRLELRMVWVEHAIQAARKTEALADLGRFYALTMGWVCIKRGELDQARGWLDHGLQIIRQSNNQKLECAALRFLGRLTLIEGQAEQARQIYEDVLSIASAESLEDLEAALKSDLAYWEMQYGTLDEAERYIQESISIFEDLGDSIRVSDRSIMLANILVHQGKYSEAENVLLPNLQRLKEELDQPEAVAAGYACLAHIRAHEGDLSEATWCCKRARKIYEEVGIQEETFPIGLPRVC
jgi:tetratricopeptide (TPR) repeat protein